MARHFHCDFGSLAKARNIADRHIAALMQPRRHNPDGSFHSVLSGSDPSQVSQRRYQPNRPVSAHSQIADIIKEDHARRARAIKRFAQQRTHHHVRAARFINNS